ncbi:Nucleoside-diphosphate-sugar epimerase [Saccharopolyspora antimicrobica]|uniref:Nucleoside-diphosphate-sugar epimerase n=1 Tax=Saccharopolyspora antimicrobica TaxID=455193 RepID=A0A1I5HRC6_9PSEU|nr:NAD(P)-dependent oxidoreductase [Saccharopolyspora antimicrobica]RKT82389.1 nucleoside-diphosphate-sugar epimerase [Saccharopolyspora antimicrobica]SFO50361.1 Nucleoside-diphosphate-sugar epimerase [Saccharopolyspora antimicrobica]
MRIVLAGATGTLSSELVPRLLAAGHEVVGLTRTASGAQRLRTAGVTPVVTDVMAADALLTALDGRTADAVIHQATAITRTPAFHRDLHPTDALRDVGTRNLLRAAKRLGARRFVTQSFFLGYGWRDHGPGLLTEDHPYAEPERGPFGHHMRSLRSNEDQVLRSPDLEGIALRYGLFYGPEPATRKMLELTRKRQLPIPRPAATLHPIHIADAASATVAALERGRAGQAYNIVDDQPVDMGDYLAALAETAGAPPPRRVPGWLFRAVPYMHSLLVGTRIGLDNSKAKRELGWAPEYPTYRDGLPSTVDR